MARTGVWRYDSVQSIYKEIKQFELPDNFEIYDHATDKLIDNTQKVIQTFNDYEKRLFDIHVNSGISGNKLAKATGINKYSIYRTIKKCKDKIKKDIELKTM